MLHKITQRIRAPGVTVLWFVALELRELGARDETALPRGDLEVVSLGDDAGAALSGACLEADMRDQLVERVAKKAARSSIRFCSCSGSHGSRGSL